MKGTHHMNTKRFTPVVFSTAIMFCALHCAGQSNVVYYGANSNALDVVFVDTNLSQQAQSAIVADLNVCLSEWGKTAELCLRNRGDSVGYLYIGTHCPHYPKIGGGAPEDMDFPKNVVSNGTSGVALQVPKKLSDAYTNAFEFAKANSNAFAAVNAFVAVVSSTNFANTAPNALPDYFLHAEKTADEIIANSSGIIGDIHYRTYYRPSVLGFKYLSGWPSGILATPHLCMRIPASSNFYGRKEWTGELAVWHKGKWWLFLWEE